MKQESTGFKIELQWKLFPNRVDAVAKIGIPSTCHLFITHDAHIEMIHLHYNYEVVEYWCYVFRSQQLYDSIEIYRRKIKDIGVFFYSPDKR